MEGGAGELAEYRNGIRYSHIDRGDHVEIIMEGILMNAHGIIWAAGVSKSIDRTTFFALIQSLHNPLLCSNHVSFEHENQGWRL